MPDPTAGQLLEVAEWREQACFRALHRVREALAEARRLLAKLITNPLTAAQRTELLKDYQAERQAVVDAVAALPLNPVNFAPTAEELTKLFPPATPADL